jgi:hypothetical protein
MNIYNNNQIQENKNIYNLNYNENNNIKMRNLDYSSLNKGVFSQYINYVNNDNYGLLYNNYNDYSINNINSDLNNINKNDINLVYEINNKNQRNIKKENKLLVNKTAENFYPLNIEKNREKEIIDIYSTHNNEQIPQDNKRDNNQFINFNNNSFLYLAAGQTQNISIDQNILNGNINDINQINNIWSSTTNNTSQINNNINSQYIQLEQQTENNNNNLIKNLNDINGNNDELTIYMLF